VQVKHNLEVEVENIETEIMKLRAQFERDNDFEQTKISADETIAEDKALHENIVSVAAVSQDKSSDLSQKSAYLNKQRTDFLQDPMYGSLEFKHTSSNQSLQDELDRNISQKHIESLILKSLCIVDDVPSADNDAISCRSFLKASETVVSDQSAYLLATHQGAVSHSIKQELAACAVEDCHELSANTTMLFQGMVLPHITTDRQDTSLTGCMTSVDEDGDRLACASMEGPADMSVGAVTQAVTSSLGHSVCNISAAALVDVCADKLTVNASCIQSAHTGVSDTDFAIPDSLDGISAACDAAEDTDSCVSGEDSVVPDSEDDLFCSQYDGHIDCTALPSHCDELKYVNKTATFSDISSDVLDLSDTVDGCALLVNRSRLEGDSTVDHLAENVDQERQTGKHNYGNNNDDSLFRYNRKPSERNHVSMPVTDSADIIKHADCLPSINVTFDQCPPPMSSVVQEQFPKRPQWTLTVSGINQALDQVILPSVDSRLW